jgi:type I restriction enzyme R subunit
MSASSFTESVVEQAALAWFESLGYGVANGAAIAPGEANAERSNYREVTLSQRLRDALARLNPDLPADSLEDAFRKVTRRELPSLVGNNRAFHKILVEGVAVEYRRDDGSIRGGSARLIDFDNPDPNDWLAVNQFTVVEGQHERRPDIVLFVNGLPLAVIELKNAADENATIWTAFNQLQTYKDQIPSLFTFNEAMVVSDGLEARIGSLTSDRQRFMKWRTIDGSELAPETIPQLEVLSKGVFEKRRFLDVIRHFVVFDDNGSGNVVKILAGYHQFHAVNKAVEASVTATSPQGDRRCGVVWCGIRRAQERA